MTKRRPVVLLQFLPVVIEVVLVLVLVWAWLLEVVLQVVVVGWLMKMWSRTQMANLDPVASVVVGLEVDKVVGLGLF